MKMISRGKSQASTQNTQKIFKNTLKDKSDGRPQVNWPKMDQIR